ncbi:vacuolar sorting protein 39 domain 2-domain-containing protein [Paraphysoderma sedebokerense]|nr:vacuolar sorting protein 39 domain 2-domain-containing protein [Paraphysoderma sedebokerense]
MSSQPYTLLPLLADIPSLLSVSVSPAIASPAVASSSIRRTFSGNTAPTPKAPQRQPLPTWGITAVESFGNDLFIGTSDGTLIHYKLPSSSASSPDQEKGRPTLIQQTKIGSGKLIESMIMLPIIRKLLVLCDSTIFCFDIPNLKPTNSVPPIKGVMCFCKDQSRGFMEEVKQRKLMVERICVAKRRIVQSLELWGKAGSDDVSIQNTKEISHDGAFAIVRVNDYICLADNQAYKIINISTGDTIPLFPYSNTTDNASFSTKPLIAVVSDNEFLVVTGSSSAVQPCIGVFVGTNGDPVRGTVQFANYPKALAFQFPHTISILRTDTILSLEIHNILSQELVQSIPLPIEAFGLNALSNNISVQDVLAKVVVRDKGNLMALGVVPVDVQVEELFRQSRIEEALILAEQAFGVPGSNNVTPKLSNYLIKAGFLYLQATLFDDALTLFRRAKLDPIFLVWMTSSDSAKSAFESDQQQSNHSIWKIVKDLGSIHDIVKRNIDQTYGSGSSVDAATIETFRSSLLHNAVETFISYLSWALDEKIGDKMIIDLGLLQSYGLQNDKLIFNHIRSIVNGKPKSEFLDKCKTILMEQNKFYALSIFYESLKEYTKMLDIWLKLSTAKLEDPDFQGPQVISEFLLSVTDIHSYWNYVKQLVEINPKEGVKIIMGRIKDFGDKGSVNEHDDVLEVLKPFGRESIIVYLQYVVFERGSKDKEKHTSLAIIYLERFMEEIGQTGTSFKNGLVQMETTYRTLNNEPTQLISFVDFLQRNSDNQDKHSYKSRYTFIDFIAKSEYIDANGLLEKLKSVERDSGLSSEDGIGLNIEKAVLYGKIGDHEKALSLFVQGAHDCIGAIEHCLRYSDKDSKMRKELVAFVFKLYLEMEDRNYYVQHISYILNHYGGDLDVNQVLESLPDTWSLDILSTFLKSKMRRSIHHTRLNMVVRGLSRREHLETSSNLTMHQESYDPIIVSSSPIVNVFCDHCGKPMLDNQFTRFPDGRVFHNACYVVWNSRTAKHEET